MDVLPPFYFDCETIPAGEPPIVIYPPKPTKEDVKIGNRKGEKADEYRDQRLPEMILEWEEKCDSLREKSLEDYKKKAVNSLTSEIVCIAYAKGDSDPGPSPSR